MAHETESDRDLFYALARSSAEAERLHQQAELRGEAADSNSYWLSALYCGIWKRKR